MARRLSIIYFLDAARTHSFGISLRTLITILVVMGLTLVWAVISCVLLWQAWDHQERLSERLRVALGTIFEYQIRYDGVYESAYPTAAPATKSEAPPVHRHVPKRMQKLDMGDLKMVHGSSDWPVAVEELSVQREGDEVEVRFAIRNQASGGRAEGSMWVVAEFSTDGGARQFFSAPGDMPVGDDGSLTGPARGVPYSIRAYKPKTFYLGLPADYPGELISLRLGMRDQRGRIQEFHYRVYALAHKG